MLTMPDFLAAVDTSCRVHVYDGKKLYRIYYPNHSLIYSYDTCIGYILTIDDKETCYLTNTKQTTTTSRHVNYLKHRYSAILISQDKLKIEVLKLCQ